MTRSLGACVLALLLSSKCVADPTSTLIIGHPYYQLVRGGYGGLENYGFVGALGLAFPNHYYGSEYDVGFEYRRYGDLTITVYTDYLKSFMRSDPNFGPYISGGIGIGAAKRATWQEHLEMRVELGYRHRFRGVKPQFEFSGLYRVGFDSFANDPHPMQAFGVAATVIFKLGEIEEELGGQLEPGR